MSKQKENFPALQRCRKEKLELEAKVERYRELLKAMARRDKNLDPVWMEQFAIKELADLTKEQSE